MNYVRNRKGINDTRNYELEVCITGMDYLGAEQTYMLESVLDADLSDIVKFYFDRLNNCNLSKAEFDLYVNLVELKTASSVKETDDNITVKVYLDEQNYPYRKESVSYKKGVLVSYYSYDNIDGIKEFKYCNGEYSIGLDETNNNAQEYVKAEFQNIQNLKRVIPVRLDAETINLINAYELFYKDHINVQDSSLITKLRYMLYLLNEENITLLEGLNLDIYSEPKSKLEKIVDTLRVVSIISCDSSCVTMDESVQKQISMIGSVIQGFITNGDDDINDLYNFCAVIQMEKIQVGNIPECYKKALKLIREIKEKNQKN